MQATSDQNSASALLRGFRHESRFYVLLMVWKGGSDPGSARDRFFDSFRML